jgi:hypothetical protein
MPKIAQYEGQVKSQVSQQPGAPAPVPGMFDNPVVEGALNLAQEAAKLKGRIDTTSAEEALVQFERSKNELFFNPDNGYFNTQGKDAYDQSVNATKALDDLKAQYGESLDAQAKSMFDKSADTHITRAMSDINRHASKGLSAWEVSTIEAQVENSLENASLYWNDPDRLKVQNVLGRQAIYDSAAITGEGSEVIAEKVQTFESTFARSIIEAATQKSSVSGTEMLEKHADKLEGPDKLKMEAEIEAKAKVEKTAADARAAVLTATSLIESHDDRSTIIDEVNKIEDPELRKKTMTETMSQFSRKEQAEKEQANDYYQTSIGLVNQGMTVGEITASNPEAWEGMTDTQRNNILSGKHMITDQILLSELRSMNTKDKAKLNAVDYADKLKPSDLQKLTGEIEAAKKGKQGSRVQSLTAKTMTAAESAFGKKSRWSTGKGKLTPRGEKANEFLNAMQDAIDEFESDHDRKITPTEENEIIGEFTRAIISERSRWGFDILAADVEIDLSNSPAVDVRMLNRIVDETPDIDINDLTKAYQYLIDNDQPVNLNTIRMVYEQGRQ